MTFGSSVRYDMAVVGAMCTPAAKPVMERLVLSELPDQYDKSKLGEIRDRLEELKSRPTYVLAHQDVRDVHGDVAGLVNLMLSGNAPDEKRLKTNIFLSKVISEFLTFTVLQINLV